VFHFLGCRLGNYARGKSIAGNWLVRIVSGLERTGALFLLEINAAVGTFTKDDTLCLW
jgi:hypothetical protein